jgi:hypothetical protein
VERRMVYLYLPFMMKLVATDHGVETFTRVMGAVKTLLM